MVAHTTIQAGAKFKEDAIERVRCRGVILGEAQIAAIFKRDLPDLTDETQCNQFRRDCLAEGLITGDEEPEALTARLDEIVNDLMIQADGGQILRVEYQSVWDPEDDWQEKLVPQATPEPEQQEFEEEHGHPYQLGGTLIHASAKYEIFVIDTDAETVQAAAIFDNIRPRHVTLEFDQVKAYRPPLTAADDDLIEFTSPEVLDPVTLTQKYETLVEYCKRQHTRVGQLEAAIDAINDPSKSIVIDLTPHLAELSKRVDPARNRSADELKPHYVATMQALMESMTLAAARKWAAMDHAVTDNEDEPDLTTKLELAAQIEFGDLTTPTVSHGAVKLKLAGKGTFTLALTSPMRAVAKTPNQEELFTDEELRPRATIAPPAILAEPGETITGPDPEVMAIDDWGVQINEVQHREFTEGQRNQIQKWKEKMGGGPGIKVMPKCIATHDLAADIIVVDQMAAIKTGLVAFDEGQQKRHCPYDAGTADHFFWLHGWNEGKALNEGDKK